MKRKIWAYLAAVLVAACGDGAAAPTGEALTREEALAVAMRVAESGESAASGGVAGEATASFSVDASPPRSIRLERATSHPCPVAGRIVIELDAVTTFDVAARSFTFDADGSLTHAGCAFIHDGVTLTVDGDPDLRAEVHAAAIDGRPRGPWTSAAAGAFRWTASDGRSGRCDVDIASVTDFDERTRTVVGEVCGHTVHDVVRWSRG